MESEIIQLSHLTYTYLLRSVHGTEKNLNLPSLGFPLNYPNWLGYSTGDTDNELGISETEPTIQDKGDN